MPTYLVISESMGREAYHVDAESEADAKRQVEEDGLEPISTEIDGIDVTEVRELKS